MPTFQFDNAFVRDLPGDPEQGARLRQVEAALYSRVDPTPVATPRLLAHSAEMAARLGFSEADVASPDFAQLFGGNALLDGMQPYAANYGGHQFGHWAGQLGDGRAITLGEVVNAAGERWELQLKGAGPTPYSRSADGRAVLRSSVREFLCSEAMHHLGVPTTRALSLVATGEPVRARHVLRRPCRSRSPARSSAAWRHRSSASATSSCRPRAATPRCCGSWSTSPSAATFRSCRGDGEALYAQWFAAGVRAHRRDGRALDARGLRARRDEHRQHVDPRPHHRLRPVRLDRQLTTATGRRTPPTRSAAATASASSRTWRSGT